MLCNTLTRFYSNGLLPTGLLLDEALGTKLASWNHMGPWYTGRALGLRGTVRHQAIEPWPSPGYDRTLKGYPSPVRIRPSSSRTWQSTFSSEPSSSSFAIERQAVSGQGIEGHDKPHDEGLSCVRHMCSNRNKSDLYFATHSKEVNRTKSHLQTIRKTVQCYGSCANGYH